MILFYIDISICLKNNQWIFMKNILPFHFYFLFLSMTTCIYGAHNKTSSPSYARDTSQSRQRHQFALEKKADLQKKDDQDLSCYTPPRSPKKSDSLERTIYSPISYVPKSPKNITRSQSYDTRTRKARVSAQKFPNKFPQFADDTNDKLRASQEIQILQAIQEANKLSASKLLPTPSDFEPELSPKRSDRNKRSLITHKINDRTELRKLCAQDVYSTSQFISSTTFINHIF